MIDKSLLIAAKRILLFAKIRQQKNLIAKNEHYLGNAVLMLWRAVERKFALQIDIRSYASKKDLDNLKESRKELKIILEIEQLVSANPQSNFSDICKMMLKKKCEDDHFRRLQIKEFFSDYLERQVADSRKTNQELANKFKKNNIELGILKKTIELKKQNPDADWQQIKAMTWQCFTETKNSCPNFETIFNEVFAKIESDIPTKNTNAQKRPAESDCDENQVVPVLKRPRNVTSNTTTVDSGFSSAEFLSTSNQI